MKYKDIFLDCDGCLTSAEFLQNRIHQNIGTEAFPLDPKAVKLITNLLSSDSDIRIVLSSSWRFHKEALRVLTNVGIPIMDMIPDLHGSKNRGTEISLWLAQHESEVYSYVIIDDNADMLKQQFKRFVQTSFSIGLQQEHIERVRRILCFQLNQPIVF